MSRRVWTTPTEEQAGLERLAIHMTIALEVPMKILEIGFQGGRVLFDRAW